MKEYRLKSLESRPVLVFGERRFEVPPLPPHAIDTILELQERALKAYLKRVSLDTGPEWSYAEEMAGIIRDQRRVILDCVPDFPADLLGYDVQREVWSVLLEIAGIGLRGGEEDEGEPGGGERPTKEAPSTSKKRPKKG